MEKTPMISLNMILGGDPEEFLYWSLKSCAPFVDEYVIVDNGNPPGVHDDILQRVREETGIPLHIVIAKFDPESGYAGLRQIALENSRGSWIYKHDADEVHYNEAALLRPLLEELRSHTEINTVALHFYHFMLDFERIQFIDRQERFFRVTPDLHWEDAVHERPMPAPTPEATVDSPCAFAHYGYTKALKWIRKNHQRYHELLGIEVNSETIPGWPDHFLDDRVWECTPFPREHPEIIQEYIASQRAGRLHRTGSERPVVGVSLMGRDKWMMTDECLDLFHKNTEYGNLKLCFVDDGSRDGTARKIESRYPAWHVIRNAFPQGIVPSRNSSFEWLLDEGAEFIIVMHNDHFVPKPLDGQCWITRLVDVARIHPSCAIIGVTDVEPRLCGGYDYTTLPGGFDNYAHSSMRANRFHIDLDQNVHPCIMRADAMRDIGLYDPRYRLVGFEDLDWLLRVKLQGKWKIAKTGAVSVFHRSMQTRAHVPGAEEAMIANRLRFISQWGDIGELALAGRLDEVSF